MLKIATVCTGIGAPEKALTNLGIPYEVIFFSEIDTPAIRSYCAIHNENGSKNLGDLSKIDFNKLSADIDLIVGGTPCQDFSTSGLGKGGEEGSGTRSSLMWYYVKMIETIRPKVVVWENVAAVLSRNHIRTYYKFYSTFTALGYNVNVNLLNAKMFNLPQNRVRIFLVAIRNDIEIKFKFPYGYDSGVRIHDAIKDNISESYYTKCIDDFDLYRKNNIPLHGMIQLGKLKKSAFKQNYELLSIGGIFDCLTTKCGNFILDDRIQREKPIRHLIPNESLLFMGFSDEDYSKCKNAGVSESELYVQAGNSIAVNVLMAIFGQLYNVPWREKVFKERHKTEEQLLNELPLFAYMKEREDAAA